MKKIVSLALAMLLVLSLAACGSKNSGTGDVSDALTLLNTVWATYSEEEKFPVSGGDYDHPVDDAPGAFDISNADNMDDMLGPSSLPWPSALPQAWAMWRWRPSSSSSWRRRCWR